MICNHNSFVCILVMMHYITCLWGGAFWNPGADDLFIWTVGSRMEIRASRIKCGVTACGKAGYGGQYGVF
jgi:hypothetical protein